MPFDWSKYLTLAKIIAADESEENVRCAVSRAYYAVFKIACKKIGLQDHYNAHDKLSKYFTELDLTVTNNFPDLDDKTLKQIGEDIIHLKLQRIHADYNPKNFNCLQIGAILTRSEKVIDMLLNK